MTETLLGSELARTVTYVRRGTSVQVKALVSDRDTNFDTGEVEILHDVLLFTVDPTKLPEGRARVNDSIIHQGSRYLVQEATRLSTDGLRLTLPAARVTAS
jgi:hypothetical protein